MCHHYNGLVHQKSCPKAYNCSRVKKLDQRRSAISTMRIKMARVSMWNATFNIITSPAKPLSTEKWRNHNDPILFYFTICYIYKVTNKSNFWLKTILHFSDDSLSKFCMFYIINNGHDFVLYYGVGWIKNIWKIDRWNMKFDIFPINKSEKEFYKFTFGNNEFVQYKIWHCC